MFGQCWRLCWKIQLCTCNSLRPLCLYFPGTPRMFVLICWMLSDFKVEYSVSSVPELHTLTCKGHRKKMPIWPQCYNTCGCCNVFIFCLESATWEVLRGLMTPQMPWTMWWGENHCLHRTEFLAIQSLLVHWLSYPDSYTSYYSGY